MSWLLLFTVLAIVGAGDLPAESEWSDFDETDPEFDGTQHHDWCEGLADADEARAAASGKGLKLKRQSCHATLPCQHTLPCHSTLSARHTLSAPLLSCHRDHTLSPTVRALWAAAQPTQHGGLRF